MIFVCVCALLAIVAISYSLASSWIGGLPKLNYAYNTGATAPAPYPDANFAVISDLHIYDHSLGTEGAAFDAAMKSDRKLLLDSVDLLDYAIDDILRSNARFVLVSGDLTKDGELINHNISAEMLARLTDAGLQVYVVPGNHDISCYDAVSYSGSAVTPVETVTPEEFASIYADFGYDNAIERDPHSLSYMAEPVDGLLLLVIDACRYRENRPGQDTIVGGKISQATADWIAGVLSAASESQKAVMVLMHHGIVAHWDGQQKLHPDYLIEDYRHFGEFLASHHVRLAFTGHYHAQDITRGAFRDGTYIYDVETGSLVTAPCPIRYCSIKDNTFTVKSVNIVDKIHPGTDFARNATDFVKATVVLEAFNTLKKYRVSDKDAEYIADAVGDAFVAHYKGDENPDERAVLDKSLLSFWGRFILFMQQYVLNGLWADLYPADNDAAFSLD